MRRWSLVDMLLLIAGSALAWLVVAAACLMVGSSGAVGWPDTRYILEFRRQQTLVASLVGAALAAAGVAYQAILRNPLAEPYLLGVSSGASLAVYVWGLVPLGAVWLLSQQAFAFAGALATLLVVFGLSQRRGRLEPVTLLLVGVIVNAICGAMFLLLFNLASLVQAQDNTRALRFLAGGIQRELDAAQIWPVAICFVLGWVALLALSGQLNVSTLSEAEAESLGVRIQRLRWIGLVIASLMTASAVAISGPIGFVGLVCPHVARLIVGNDQRRLLPVATALGACLLAVADVGSRRLAQLPVGVLTGFLGGPFFLVLLWRSRGGMGATTRTAGGTA
jgi:iron complex transport system permease protein